MSQQCIRLSVLRCERMCRGIVHFYLSNNHKCPKPLEQCNQSTKRNTEGSNDLFLCSPCCWFARRWWFPRRSSASSARLWSSIWRTCPLRGTAFSESHHCCTFPLRLHRCCAPSTSSCLIINVFFSRDLTVFLTVRRTSANIPPSDLGVCLRGSNTHTHTHTHVSSLSLQNLSKILDLQWVGSD